MSNVTYLPDIIKIRGSAQAAEKIAEEARAGLSEALSINLNYLNGKQLRKVRDDITNFDRCLLALDNRLLIEQAIQERQTIAKHEGRKAPTQEELNIAANVAIEQLIIKRKRRVVFAITEAGAQDLEEWR